MLELEIQLQRKDEKIEELYQSMQTLEKERSRLREALIKYEEENIKQTIYLEE